MERVFRAVSDLATDDGFAVFQNAVVARLYDALGQGYSGGDNEVALVSRLVDAANGQSYGPLHIRATMLHGTRSYVEFNYLDRPVTKELGDMALITVVTAGRQRLLAKLSIVQNKKAHGDSWPIDREQLFLLKNFPPLAGNKGIFRGVRDLTFRNLSGCLGSFGLLTPPGEMIFASAPLVSEMLRGKESVSLTDISVVSARLDPVRAPAPFPGLMGLHPRDWYYLLRELHNVGLPFFPLSAPLSGFLGNVRFGRDLYDILRSLTELSIGELTFLGDRVVSTSADAFANLLIRAAGFANLFDLGGGDLLVEREFPGLMAVILVHLNVE